MSEREKTVNELILLELKSEFERTDFDISNPQSGQNIWIMAAAVLPFDETLETSDFLPYNIKGSKNHDPETDEAIRNEYRNKGIPTHIARIVVRCSFDSGTQQYVDGTDVYVSVDVDKQVVMNIWVEAWADGPPKFHGGTVPAAITWVRQMVEPFYIQSKDPFLTPEQRIALNGHDEDYQTVEPSECKPDFSPNHSDEDDWI